MAKISVLELFLMSCVERGLTSQYAMLRQASVSLGASTPALKRLVSSGRLSRLKPNTTSARLRHEYKIARKGVSELRKEIAGHLAASDAAHDLDSVLRIVDMARRYGTPHATVVSFLQRASEHRKQLAERALFELAAGGESRSFEYPRLRQRLDAARFDAEAKELAGLARGNKSRRKPIQSKTAAMHQASLLSTSS